MDRRRTISRLIHRRSPLGRRRVAPTGRPTARVQTDAARMAIGRRAVRTNVAPMDRALTIADQEAPATVALALKGETVALNAAIRKVVVPATVALVKKDLMAIVDRDRTVEGPMARDLATEALMATVVRIVVRIVARRARPATTIRIAMSIPSWPNY